MAEILGPSSGKPAALTAKSTGCQKHMNIEIAWRQNHDNPYEGF